MKNILKTLLLVPATLFYFSSFAQDSAATNKKGSKLRFTKVAEEKCTSVKDQFHSGTCWCFSTESFLESEFMRMGKGNIDISEMWIVRAGYIEKAKKYMRMMGKTNFGPGGEPHDVINLSATYGIVPQSVYSGLPNGEDKIRHGEMDDVLKAILDAQLKLSEGKLSPNWLAAFTAALDAYLGAPPANFVVDGKTYTPNSYATFLGFKPSDYVAITSFTHHPFYSQFPLEIPDNWSWGMLYNIPMEEMNAVATNAVMNGFTVAWGADVSENFFAYRSGLAIVPETDWDKIPKEEKDSIFLKPCKDKVITQQMRQDAFDNLSTQDDHGMQISGMVKDQTGKKYYIVKNSWGAENNDLSGYFYASEAYFEFKTTSILINKAALPKDIAKKMGFIQ
ncbi:MAG: aminopeptidase [Bacteroidetes bacterium]|nr:aminopeptidase [Bacteroidota bacterium]